MTIRRGTQARAGAGAYAHDTSGLGMQHHVPEGTVATAGQCYRTILGTVVADWTVDGVQGDGWALGGTWYVVEEVAANV